MAKVDEGYVESTQLAKLIDALYLKGLQDIEDAIFSIIPKLSIDDITGKSLDGIGDIVGQSRNGLDDATYKIHLKGKIALNSSEGTLSDLYIVWNAFSGSVSSLIREIYPAGIEVETDISPPTAFIPIIKEYLDRAAVAGVKLGGIVLYDPVDAFQFSSSINSTTDSLHGFGDTADLNTGGKLAGLL